ncbi:hypothetical protein A2640_02145 [Candidatus Nomurabacteria bacterium RIFCSPHIGHO2_01_FULL_36_23]|nr:MAG: hypothetical protein A2640_02145 [Candidatus Nomurabacteria bacterium RIFCSPHIGHO2_01_FULL_36_23]
MKKIFKISFVVLGIFAVGSFFTNQIFAEDIVLEEIIVVPDPVTLSNIAITNPADKTEYIVGDTLNITGLVVTGTYSDNSTNIETITEENISDFDSTFPAVGQILTITVGEQTATYTININAAEETGGDSPLLIEKDITLNYGCETEDTDGVMHVFPEEDSPSDYLAICALVSARDAGDITDFKLVNSSFGLYVQSVNDEDPSDTEYWALWLNGKFANCGIVCLPLVKGDTLSLILSDWMTNTESTTIKLHVIDLVPLPQEEDGDDTGGGGGSETPKPEFNTENAIAYLKSVQKENGSFEDSLLYTDWAGIAFGALNVIDNSRDTLLAYLNSHNTLSSLVTDNERRAITLLALEQDPYSFNGVNYISAIISSFDDTQFGDTNLVNDDIFALIPLKNSGYTASDDIIIKDIAFLISKQKINGSWEESVDITAATIQALKSFELIDGVSEALLKAADYLADKQNSDGGWGNVFSTSWVIQAMNTLGASWTKDNKTGIDYLGAQQVIDGAVSPSSETFANRIWATSYASVAGSEKSWNEIMQSVPKPAIKNNSNNSSAGISKKTNSQTPTNPIVCPLGHSFSVTTGQACTTTALIDSTSLPQTFLANNKFDDKKKSVVSQIQKTATPSDLPEKTKTLEIIPETLIATAVNTLPIKNTSQNLPIVLGTVSGLILLYVAFKFLIP